MTAEGKVVNTYLFIPVLKTSHVSLFKYKLQNLTSVQYINILGLSLKSLLQKRADIHYQNKQEWTIQQIVQRFKLFTSPYMH
jgi:hypothetical protein